MKTETSTLRDQWGTTAVVELLALVIVATGGVLLRWHTLHEFGLGLIAAGIVMMFLSAVSPIGSGQVTVDTDDLVYVEDGALMVELFGVGLANTVLGIVLAVIGQ